MKAIFLDTNYTLQGMKNPNYFSRANKISRAQKEKCSDFYPHYLLTGRWFVNCCSAWLTTSNASWVACRPAQWVRFFQASVVQPSGACFSIHLNRSGRLTPASSSFSYKKRQFIGLVFRTFFGLSSHPYSSLQLFWHCACKINNPQNQHTSSSTTDNQTNCQVSGNLQ